MANEFKVLIGAELSKDINLQKEIDKIKGLHLTIDSVTINKEAINSIKAELNRTNTALNLDFHINGESATQEAKKVTERIQRSINGVVQKSNFKQIFDPGNINEAARVAERYFKTLSNTVSVQEKLGNAKNLQSFTVSLKNSEGVVERLNYNLRELTDDNGKVLKSYFEYSGGTINNNGIIQQFTAISAKADELTLKLEKIKAAYSDTNAPKAIKNSDHVQGLTAQYNNVQTAIEALKNSDSSTFSTMVANANKEIATLENLVSQYKNAEYAATSLRTRDIATIKIDEGNKLDKLIADMQRSGTYTDELKAKVASLKVQLSSISSSSDLTSYLNNLGNLETRYKAVASEIKATSQAQKLYAEKARVLSNIDRILAQNSRMTSELKQKFLELRIAVDGCDDGNALTNLKLQMSQLNNEMKASGKYGPNAIDTLKQNIEKFTSWFFIGGTVATAVRSVRYAVRSLREVDDILVEISKTSDMTETQLKRLGETAFDSASKLGKKATDYLVAVQEMSRSGYYGKQGESMANVSLLTQSAGDVDADVANRYILATNAAYKLQGQAEKLNAVLDGQNMITNRNSVAMADMAEAMSKSGTVASSYRVGIEDLSAMIGTIEAVTKLEGSEVGTGIKSILINLQNVSSSKIVDTLTEANASMTEFVNGTEQLRNPITILRDLSKTFNELDEKDPLRAKILTNIGGKVYHVA